MSEEKIYTSLGLGETVDRLLDKKNTLIICHRKPDGDAVGSAAALKLVLEEAGMKAVCVCADEIPSRLKFLPTGQSTFLEEKLGDISEFERIITVDTASPTQLGTLADKYLGKIELMIDHHEKGTVYADNYIAPGAPATGELIFDIAGEMLKRGAIENMPIDAAICIYAAISSDTGCFKYTSVSPKTHRIAACLLESGVNAGEINHLLFDSKPYVQLKAEQLGFERIRLYCGGKAAIMEFPYSLKIEHGIENQYLETLVDVTRSIEGVGIAAVLKQTEENGPFRCSLRSSCDTDVAEICAVFGGGGHAKAAGCSISAGSMEEARLLLLAEIEKRLS